MTIRRLVILHGYMGYPEKHWFRWLAGRLEPHGIETTIPALPETDAPEPEPWLETAIAAIGEVGPGTAVVGHSLGTLTAIRALGRILDQQPEARLGALALVAPFVDRVPGIPEIDAFVADIPDLAALTARIDRRLVMHSDHDEVVPIELAQRVIEGLGAEVQVVAGGGHFMEVEGWTELPQLEAWLRGA